MYDNSIWVVIPTYWGPTKLGIYDHPTPIDGPSTLPRLLDSLVHQKFSSIFEILVLVSAVSTKYEQIATTRIREIVAPYFNKLRITLADATVALQIDQYLASYQLDLKISGMCGYSTVRNMQLLIPAALGAEVIIALDDDEIVSPTYLDQATTWIGTKVNGKTTTGLTGPYLNEVGSPYLPETKQVKSSHPEFDEIANYLQNESNDYEMHEGIFIQISSKYDTLFGAFIHRTNSRSFSRSSSSSSWSGSM